MDFNPNVSIPHALLLLEYLNPNVVFNFFHRKGMIQKKIQNMTKPTLGYILAHQLS